MFISTSPVVSRCQESNKVLLSAESVFNNRQVDSRHSVWGPRCFAFEFLLKQKNEYDNESNLN